MRTSRAIHLRIMAERATKFAEGFLWCSHCQEFKVIEAFYLSRSKKADSNRLNKVRENRPEIPLPEFTPKEVEEAIERFNTTAPAEGRVIDYRPGPDRWSR